MITPLVIFLFHMLTAGNKYSDFSAFLYYLQV